jgi:hypothetical protein
LFPTMNNQQISESAFDEEFASGSGAANVPADP